ncbi:MAG: arylformamidase [Bacillus sp. (in: firmicutes)]
MSWIDISQPLTANIAVWPGDTPFQYTVSCTKEESGSVNIGSLTMSMHTGTHIDAPFHFDNNGLRVLDLNVSVYVGKARVIDVSAFESIGREQLANFELEGVKRLLLKSKTANNPAVFPEKISFLRADAAPFLQAKGIVLIGVEVPSVDPLDSKDLPAHHALFHHGVHILENIVLSQVEEGDYELIALPLALEEADGSPVRAIIKPTRR